MKDFLNFLLDVVKVFKPDLRKWMVRTFVVAGIGLLSHRFWEPYAEAILNMTLNINPRTSDITGWIFIVTGVLLFLLNRYDEHSQRTLPTQAGAEHSEGPRPLLMYAVDTWNHEGRFNTVALRFTHVLLVIENRGNLTAENHLPYVLVEDENGVVFDNSDKLSKAGIVGEIPPGDHVGFNMYKLLQNPPSKLSVEIDLYGFYAVINREFKVKAYSTYSGPNGKGQYDTANFEFRFRWFQKEDKWGPVLAHIDTATYTRERNGVGLATNDRRTKNENGGIGRKNSGN